MHIGFMEYLKSQNKSQSTINGYTLAKQGYFTWFCSVNGKEPIKLEEQDIIEYISYLRTIKSLKEKTIYYKMISLKKYNEFLIQSGVQEDIVISSAMKPKPVHMARTITLVTMQDINQLRLEVLSQGSKRDYALINLLVCGIRISEALGLTLTDCRNIHQTKALMIKTMKTQGTTFSKIPSQRPVFLPDIVMDSLKDYIDHDRNTYKSSNDSNYLFVSNKNTSLDRGTVNKMLTKYCKHAKLENITPIQLYRSSLYIIMEQCTTVAEAAYIRGDTSILSALSYMTTQQTNLGLTKMVEKLNSLLVKE